MVIRVYGSLGEGCINQKVLSAPLWPILLPPRVGSVAKTEVK